MSDALRCAVIAELTKELKLPTVGRQYPELARQAANEGWPYEDFPRASLLRGPDPPGALRPGTGAPSPFPRAEDPLPDRVGGARGRESAEALGTRRLRLHRQGRGHRLGRSVGTGKTHLAIALGMEAAMRRRRVFFIRAADLVRDLTEARDARQLGRMQQRLSTVPLLVLDELGFVPFERSGGELLFNLLSERHGRRSTILTTNLAFSEWTQVFGDELLTTALLDRLAESSHVLTLSGESYRMKRRKRKT